MRHFLFESVKRNFIKNVSAITFFQFLRQLLGIVSGTLLTSRLTLNDYSQYALVISQVSIFMIFVGMGQRNVIIKLLSRNPTQLSLTRIIISSLKLSSLAFFLTCFIVFFYNLSIQSGVHGLFFWTILFLLFCNMVQSLVETIAVGLEKNGELGLLGFLSSLIWVALLYFNFSNEIDITLILYFLIATQIVTLFLYINWLLKIKKSLLPNNLYSEQILLFPQDLFKMSIPFFLLSILNWCQVKLPILFLQVNNTKQEVAFFLLGTNLIGSLDFVFNSIVLGAFPVLIRQATIDMNNFYKAIFFLTKWVFLFSTFFAVLFTVFSEEIIVLLYGSNYSSASVVIIHYVWFQVFLFLYTIMGMILNVIDKERKLLFLAISFTLLFLPLTYYGSLFDAETLSKSFVYASILNIFLHLYVYFKITKNVKSTKQFSLFFIIISILSYLAPSLRTVINFPLYNIVFFGVIFALLIFLSFKEFRKFAFV